MAVAAAATGNLTLCLHPLRYAGVIRVDRNLDRHFEPTQLFVSASSSDSAVAFSS
jgi:hypothetical protein